jgi:hypothetical protein
LVVLAAGCGKAPGVLNAANSTTSSSVSTGGAGAGSSGTTTSTSGAATTSVSIASPADGDKIKGNVVVLTLAATGIDIKKADGDTSGKSGHYHVYVDGDPPVAGTVIPKTSTIIHAATPTVTVAGLTAGPHKFTVVLGDGAHHRLGTAQASVSVTVLGPAVQASAPATVPAGQPVTITATVSGVTLVPADGDTSGQTGHLHFFVDRDPTPAGQPIPKEAGIIHTAETSASIPGLAAGAHTVWVVVGDGAHVPLAPPVMAQVTFTVTA